MNLHFDRLSAEHDRKNFNSGVHELDVYIKTQAGQDVRRSLSSVYVLSDDAGVVVGFYTLSQYAVSVQDIPVQFARKLPPNRLVACTLLGRLAVDVSVQGEGLGKTLLFHALKQAEEFSRKIASFAVIVDAKNLKTREFYSKHGFIEFDSQPMRLFVPTRAINNLLKN